MIRSLGVLLAALLLLLLPSCYVVVHDYDGPREITPGTTLSQPSESLGQVEAGEKAMFLLWGLIPLNSASAARRVDTEAVNRHGAAVDGVTKVSIHEEEDALDVIVGILTLGIFSMRTVEVRGEAHSFSAGGAE